MANRKFVVNLGGKKLKRLEALISKDRASAKVILKTHPAASGSGRCRGGLPTRRPAALSIPTSRR